MFTQGSGVAPSPWATIRSSLRDFWSGCAKRIRLKGDGKWRGRELQITNHKLQITNYKSQITNHKLQIGHRISNRNVRLAGKWKMENGELQITNYRLQIIQVRLKD